MVVGIRLATVGIWRQVSIMPKDMIHWFWAHDVRHKEIK
jgi:hypothetical protein